MNPLVGIVIASSERGGFTAVVAEAHELVARGCRVSVLSPPGRRIAELPKDAEHVTLGVGSKNVIPAIRTIYRWARDTSPNVVHVHGRSAGFTARIALARAGVPIAYTPHGVSAYRNPVMRCIDRFVQRRLSAVTQLFLMVGNAERAEWEREHGFGSSAVRLLPNVVDPAPLASNAGTASPDKAKPYVLVPGAYHPRKRFVDVVEALALCSENARPKIRFVGSGAGFRRTYRTELASRATELGIARWVSFEDELTNLPAEMADADLVIFPSETEGRPYAALEAVAVGACVAWSDIPAHREIFGDTGVSFRVRDVDTLRTLLQETHRWRTARVDETRANLIYREGSATREDALRALCTLGTLARMP